MLQKTVGIVLHTLKYNDTSNIVEMYTELSGRVSFLVPVPRSRKSAVKSVLFQPLSLIEIEADFRPNATLYKIKEAKSFFLSLRYLTILINRLLRFSWPSSFIVRFVKRQRIGRCLLIWYIPSLGWTNAARGLLISIWCF